MRLHRFYIKNGIREDVFDITDRELVHQWKNVFRYNVGSQVILFDGKGTDYLTMITSLRNLGATVEVMEKKIKKPEGENRKKLWLCMGLIKKDNFELVVEKATELGVSHIVPVLCERSEKKSINMERLEKIAIEASEQSGRGDIPKVHEVVTLSDLLKNNTLPTNKIHLNLKGQTLNLKAEDQELAVFIGPEGGWSEREIEEFSLHNIPSVSLGSPTLRSETAAIAVSSLVLL